MQKLSLTDIKIIDGDRGNNYPSKTDFLSNGYCLFLDASNVTKNGFCFDSCFFISKEKDSFLRNGRLNRNDIVLTTRGTVGNVAIYTNRIPYDKVRINSGMLIIRTESDFLPIFLYYLFKSPFVSKQIERYTSGSSQPQLTVSIVNDLILLNPEKKEQQKIADVLSALDDKIELNNKINAELEATAKELYNYWFVQFDFPDENGRPYKSSGGKMVYNPILKREIPDGWTVECLAKNCLANILKPGIQVFEGEKIYLPTAAIEGDKIVDKTNVITYKNREGRANMQPVSNSIWFAKMKNTKKTLYFGEYSKENLDVLILSTGMCGVKCNKNALEYIWNFVNDCGFERTKNKLSHGATQEGINNDDLFYFPILVPTNDVLTAFSSLTNKLYMEKYSKEKENDSLVNLRDFLLPMLMNGQVSVD